MSILVNGGEHREGIAKSAAATVGRSVKRFKQGAQQGLKLAAKGHTHTGQIGTGVAGKPTFSVRPGTAMSRRLGVHAGVAAGNAPTLAAGAAVGAAAERHHVRKSAFGVELSKGEKSDDARRGFRSGKNVARWERENGQTRRKAYRQGAEATGKKSTIGVPFAGVHIRQRPAHRAAGKVGAVAGAAKGKSAIDKGLRSAMVARTVDRSFKAAGRERALTGGASELRFKSVPKRTAPLTGPGSARRELDSSAAATRDAADRRSIGKSAFGVDL